MNYLKDLADWDFEWNISTAPMAASKLFISNTLFSFFLIFSIFWKKLKMVILFNIFKKYYNREKIFL